MWFDKENSTETLEGSKPSPWGDSIGSAISDARKAGVGSKARAKARESGNEKSESGGSLSEEGRRKLAKVFEPEAWRAIVKMPFALGQALTGRECWKATPEQESTLAVSTSATAEYFLAVEPKWAVAFICATNWLVILSEKFIVNARERNKELEMNPPKEMATPNGSPGHPVMVK